MAEPVALGIKPPTPISLGDMLNIARGAQAYQQAEQLNPLAAQKAQMEIEQLQKINPLAVRQQAALATTAETGATKGQAELQAYYKDQARKTFGGLLTDKDFDPLNPNPEGIKAKIQEAGDYLTNVLGVPEHESKSQAKLLEHIDKHGVAGAQRVIQQIANGVQQAGTSSEQFAQANRAPTQLGTGAQTILKPTSRYQLGQPTLTQEAELPPTTEIVNPITGEKKLIGPVSQRTNQPLTTSLSPTQQKVVEGVGDIVSDDITKTVADAKEAPTRIGIFQNIKKLTPEALTGPTAERRQVIASFAQMLGMDVAKLETTATDELVKNTKLLQLAGGNTDAARALAEFANPNTKMTKEGINRVTDQLIGIEKMRVARNNFLTPFMQNANVYQQKAQQFNQISDARLFQEMSPEEVVKLRRSMFPADQLELSRKIKLAKELGVL